MWNKKALMEELNELWNDGHEEALMYLIDQTAKFNTRAIIFGFLAGLPIVLVVNWAAIRQINKIGQHEKES